MDISFLSLAEVLAIHRDQINRYGGESGIRDINLLLSAINTPQASFEGQYLHKDIHEMAGAYLFHIVQNHPFVDGNKRVGTMAAYVFLFINGYELDVPPQDLTQIVVSLTSGHVSKPDIISFIQEYSYKH